MSGNAADPGLFQTPLFAQMHLENKLHTITLTNAGTDPNRLLDYLDLDYVRDQATSCYFMLYQQLSIGQITWETTFGTDSEQSNETTLQDSDPSFSYQPQGSWNRNPPFLSFFYGQSGQ
jgi:hypothetical protein